jgi:hypothetical protein
MMSLSGPASLPRHAPIARCRTMQDNRGYRDLSDDEVWPMRGKCLDNPSRCRRWCFYAVSQGLSFAGLSRSASIAAFLAGVSHTAFGCCAARP